MSRYVAEDALDLIEVEYDVLPAVVLDRGRARLRTHHSCTRGSEDNVCVHVLQHSGDPEAALAAAPHRVSESFSITRGGGHSMETRGTVARFDEATGQLSVWDSTQSPHYARNMLAYLYGMPEEDIRLIAPADVGGGFGPKAQFYGEEAVVPWLAMHLGRPVKWIEDRRENFVATMMERSSVHEVEIGFDDEGRILVVRNVFAARPGRLLCGTAGADDHPEHAARAVQDPQHPHRAAGLLHQHGADQLGARSR